MFENFAWSTRESVLSVFWAVYVSCLLANIYYFWKNETWKIPGAMLRLGRPLVLYGLLAVMLVTAPAEMEKFYGYMMLIFFLFVLPIIDVIRLVIKK